MGPLQKKFLRFIVIFVALASMVNATTLHIALEGNTGAGKSTLSKILAEHLSASIVPEPFEHWLNVADKGNLFDQFLADGKQWSMYLTIYSTITKIRALEQVARSNNHELIIIDRSILSDGNAFAKVHTTQGLLSQEQVTTYTEFLLATLGDVRILSKKSGDIFDGYKHAFSDPLKQEIVTQASKIMTEGAAYKIDGLIYLRTSPSICKKRADERDRDYRDADSGPVGQFYEKLGSAHDEWLQHRQSIEWQGKNIPVLILNGDVDFVGDAMARAALIQQVRQFITRLQNAY